MISISNRKVTFFRNNNNNNNFDNNNNNKKKQIFALWSVFAEAQT